jgi:WD40 repeat protein
MSKDTGPAATIHHEFCPYKGLQPYTEADRDFFFGRDRDQEIIASNLYASPLTVLYGASGVGKSSVLMAGVVPLLSQTPRLAVVVFRSWQCEDCLSALKNEIRLAVQQSVGKPVEVDLTLPLDEFIEHCIRIVRGPMFIILDQFEEYFLYHPISQNNNNFDVEFSLAVNRHEVNANFILSMREDGLSKLDRFQGRIPTLLNNMLRVEHLDHSGANDAIRKPLIQYNRSLPDGQKPFEVEDKLVDALLEGVTTEKGALDQTSPEQVSNRVRVALSNAGIETPFLQMVLTRLWQEEVLAGSRVLRLSTLNRLGGTANIARTHLDKQIETLSVSERTRAAQLFRYLVTPSGAKIAQEALALAAWAELKEEEVQSLLTKLSSQEMRILRTVSAPGQPTRYEVFHDVLAQAILDWQTRRRLERERSRVKRLKVGLTLLLVLLVAFVTFGLRWQKKVQEQQDTVRADRIARSSTSVGDPELRLLLASEAVKIRHTAETESKLKQALGSPLRAVLRGHTKRVRTAAYSPDGKFVVTASDDTTALVWDMATLLEVDGAVLEHPDIVYGATYSPDGKFIATACRDAKARIWEVGSWTLVVELTGHAKAVRSIEFSPDGTLLATASEDNLAFVWQKTGTGWNKAGELKGHEGFVQTASFSRDGKLIITSSRDNTIRIWDVATRKQLHKLQDKTVVRGAIFSPDGTLVVTCNENNVIIIWTLKNGSWQANRTLDKHVDFVHSVSFSPDGNFLVSSGRDSKVLVWNTSTWQVTVPLVGHKDEVFSALYSPDGKRIVTASDDWTANVWKPQTDPEEISGTINELVEKAKARTSRELTKDDRQRYQLDSDGN